jgi:predicted Zn-ribbon and HTH transcriptional regulator
LPGLKYTKLNIIKGDHFMKCKCKKCGHEWDSRAKKPRACPACKAYSWDKGKKKKKEVTNG